MTSEQFSTKQQPSIDKATRNLVTNCADSAVRKIPLKSPNMPLDQALLKGLSPRKGRETIQLTEYSLFLFNLSHFPRRVCPLNSFTLYQIYLSLSFISKRNDFGLVFTNLSNSPKISISTSKDISKGTSLGTVYIRKDFAKSYNFTF